MNIYISMVQLKRIAIAKYNPFFTYHDTKEISFYHFRNTSYCPKLEKNSQEFFLYCWDHVCKVNERCLVDCFHPKFRVQKWYVIIASRNGEKFTPAVSF